MIGSKPLCIRFYREDGCIRVYDRNRYLKSIGGEKYDFIYNRIRYLIVVKSSIKFVISHNYAKMKVDSYDSLPLEKNIDFF